ncbi:hypothetical protein FACS1894156_5840 [Bacteroidia bacterium]|nr:hypothetical protein FACS1894156_5840 [Bacteroidia bacterium]
MKKNKQQTVKKTISPKYISAIFLVIISGLYISNYNRTFDEKVDLNGDNIHYYALGKALSSGRGYNNIISLKESPHRQFPPGYPAFEAVLMKVGLGSIHAIKVANGVLLYGSLILLFFILYAACKNQVIAFTATAFSASHPSLLRFATIMMSEMLFVFFTMVVILIILKWDVCKAFVVKEKRWKDGLILLALAVCMSYIYFIREMAKSFILAVALYYGIVVLQQFIGFLKAKKLRTHEIAVFNEKRKSLLRYLLVFGVIAISFVVPKMAWDARNSEVGISNNINAQSIQSFYKQGGIGGQTLTLTDWKTRLTNNLTTYTTKYVPSAIFNYSANREAKATTGEWVKGICIALLLLFGAYKLPKGSLLIFLYVGITLAVLIAWMEQYGGHRYLTPIMHFLIFLFIYGCYSVVKLLLDKIIKPKTKAEIYSRYLAIAVCIVFVVTLQPAYAASIETAESQAKTKTYTAANSSPNFVEFLDAIKWVKDNIPDSARVACRKSELFYIFSGGRKSGGIPIVMVGQPNISPEEVIERFTKEEIDYVIIDSWFRHAYFTVIPAVQKYDEKFNVVYQNGGEDNVRNPTYVIQFDPRWGYTGDMRDGKRHGQGTLVLQNGNTYTGSFANGFANGRGTLTDAQGNILARGIWRNDRLEVPE